MNNTHGITVENLFSSFPAALLSDPHLSALARAMATAFVQLGDDTKRALIYPAISQLPEELLDILAYDFKVDWYDYDYPVEAKRDLIKTNFYVHRHLGTKGAVKAALSAIFPGSLVEEWFEYGGKPYFFRVILDITEPRVSISNEAIMRAVLMYKSLRSWLEENAIIYRRRETILIRSAWGYVVYAARLCGTYPNRATQGEIYDENIIVQTDADGVPYASPRSGRIDAGQYPQSATEGRVGTERLVVESAKGGVSYTTPHSATFQAGQYPQSATEGWSTSGQIVISGEVTGAPYGVPFNGTVPQASVSGGSNDMGISAGAAGEGVSYSSPMCGSSPGSI